MGYRDETEALRAKVEHLEGELEEAQGEIARLRGEAAQGGALVLEGPGRRWLGAPSRLRFERRIDGELSSDDHEALAELLEERFGAEGRVSVLGSTFRWSLRPPAVNRIVDVRIKSKDGRTTVQISERLGQMAGGLFGGIVGGVGGGGVAGVAMGAAALLGAWAAPFAGVLWIAGTYAAVRAGFARMGARRAHQLAAALGELEREVRERASVVEDGRPAGTRARVEPDAADEPADEHEEARRRWTRGRGA